MNKKISNVEIINQVMAEVDECITINKVQNSASLNDDLSKIEDTTSEVGDNISVSRCFIHITEDGQEVHLMLYKREDRDYTYEDIIEYLEEQNVKYGIKEDVICEMIENQLYYDEILVAEGTRPKDGTDGYYEFHFNTKPETKPIIFADGSVDYNTLGKLELAEVNQLLATYHGSKKSSNGVDVYGNMIQARAVVELKPLKGKGFQLSEDGLKYYATIEGRITYEDGKLNVTPIYTVEGDVDAATGDITFNGDVIVKGNVFANVTISATANITVNGHVEVAHLIAGKDILLKNGMQGNGIGEINAKGNVMAKFLEQTKVYAKGNVNANAIVNCEIESEKSIIVSGTRGAILGGYAKAVEKIIAFSLGNKVGIQTKLIIGFEEDFKKTMSAMDDKIVDWNDRITDIQNKITDLSQKLKDSFKEELLGARNEALRDKIIYQTELKEVVEQKEQFILLKELSGNGSIVILGTVYPGSTIVINGVGEFLRGECRNVTFTARGNQVRIFSNNI